jgi:hypothetical protein
VPAISHQHQSGIPLRIGGALYLLQRLVQHALVQGLTLDVEPLELLRECPGFHWIIAQQQAEPVGGVSHASRRIQPGTQDEPQVTGDDLLAGKPGAFDQGTNSKPAAVGQQLKPMPDQNPIFSLERHHVGYRSEGHQIQQMKRKIYRQAERGDQRLHQLEGDPRSAEVVGSRRVIRPLRVNYRLCRRQLGAGQVVIGHHNTDACRARGANGIHGRNAAVAGDDERGFHGPGGLESGRSEVVAIAQTMGQEGLHVGAGQTQGAGEERRGALPVHVVVAVDQDASAGPHGAYDGVHSLAHAGERMRIGQVVQQRAQEAACCRLRAVTALHQQGGQGRRKPEGRGQRLNLGLIRLRHHSPAQHWRGKDAHHASVTE